MNGNLPCTLDEAIQFAAFQLEIEKGSVAAGVEPVFDINTGESLTLAHNKYGSNARGFPVQIRIIRKDSY